MSIQRKFFLSSSIVVLLMLVLVGGGLLSVLRAQADAEERRQDVRALQDLMMTTHAHWERADEALHEMLVADVTPERYETVLSGMAAFDESLNALTPYVHGPEMHAVLLEGRAFGASLIESLQAAAQVGPEAVQGVLQDVIEPFHELDLRIEGVIAVLLEEANAEEDLATERMAQAMRFLETFSYALMGAVVLVVGSQVAVIIRPIVRSIQQLMDGAVQIGSGNLDHRLNIRTRDEVERLGQEFNKMAENLGLSYRSLEAAKAEIEATSKALKNEMEKGRQLQQNFLPDALPQVPGWEMAAFLSPAKDVSGDFYDGFVLPNGMVGLVIGDVCDKGVGSALFMALSRSLLRIYSGHLGNGEGKPPLTNGTKGSPDGMDVQSDLLEAVTKANDYIALTHSETSMFTTLFMAYLDPARAVLTYINGGHESPAVLGASGVKSRLAPTGPAIGLFPGVKFEAKTVVLEPGDTIIAYTDGVTDAHNPAGERFSERNLLSRLAQPAPSATGLIEDIERGVRAHIGTADQFDDITMIAARRAG